MPGTRGVLLCGGAGARLALDRPKALVPLGAETLLARGVTSLASICDEVVVTAPAALEGALADALSGARDGARVPVRFRADAPARRSGPLAGMVAGLEGEGYDGALVLAVDLPFIRPALLAALLARLGQYRAVVPVVGGFPQPLAAAYAPEAVAILERAFAAGERGPTRVLAALDALRITEDQLAVLPGGPASFFNLNTRDDLAEAERRLAVREETR